MNKELTRAAGRMIGQIEIGVRYTQRMIVRGVLVGVLAMTSYATASPQIVRVDGTIFDAGGAPVSGTQDLSVEAYDAASGGTAIWASGVYSTTLAAGRFTLNLDASVGTPSLVERLAAKSATDGVWFEVSYNANVVRPRIRGRGAFFSLSAAKSDALNGVTATVAEMNRMAGVTANVQSQLAGKLALAGGTMAGSLTLANEPTAASEAATKAYVDAATSSNPNDFLNVQSFFVAGVSTWVVPEGTTRIKVEVCGGGGGGGGGNPNANYIGAHGGGAGAQAWAYLTSITVGASYTIAIGTGGAAGASSAGTGGNGSTSSFGPSGSPWISAGGGSGATSGQQGAGGTPACTVPCMATSGESGFVSFYSDFKGGEGGKSPCGGSGGSGGAYSYVNAGITTGSQGGMPGGGGGGGGASNASSTAGGAGGSGRVTIWY